MVRKLNNLLKAELADFQSGLLMAGKDRVTGYIVSSDFNGLDHKQRQALLRSILDRALSESERIKIGPIVTMTPKDAEIREIAG